MREQSNVVEIIFLFGAESSLWECFAKILPQIVKVG